MSRRKVKLRCKMVEIMEDISQDCYCAGWMQGLEKALWHAIQSGDRSYGRGEIDQTWLNDLEWISKDLGEWCYADEQYEIVFVSIDQWKELIK